MKRGSLKLGALDGKREKRSFWISRLISVSCKPRVRQELINRAKFLTVISTSVEAKGRKDYAERQISTKGSELEAASRYRKRPISWVLFNLVLKVGVMISTDLSRKHNGSNVKFEVLQKTIKESFSRTSGERLKQIYGELLKELYT